MNQRIRQLSNQAYDELVNQTGNIVVFDEDFQQRFAELIVRECVQACINEGQTFEVESAGEYSSNLYATAIKKHFGVEA